MAAGHTSEHHRWAGGGLFCSSPVLSVWCRTAWCCALHCTVCALLHCSCGQRAVGSGTRASHCHTAWRLWAVELLLCIASLPRGSGQCNSCIALPHCPGAVGSATPAIHLPYRGALARRGSFWAHSPPMTIFDSSLLCLTLFSHQTIHKLSGPLSWGYGLTIHNFVWPLELRLWTSNPQIEWPLELGILTHHLAWQP